MRVTTQTSTPLRPIASRARKLSSNCDELLVATAFVSDDAVAAVVESALRSGARVRFLTGTFGCVTRKRTFRRLHRLATRDGLDAKIWAVPGSGDLHVKLFLWRQGARGIAWIGSGNLTNRGLQAAGELMAEIQDRWSGPSVLPLRRAFENEWRRGQPLDDAFLSTYREAPRVQHLLVGNRAGKSARPTSRTRRGRGLLVLPVGVHYRDDGAVVERVEARLGGTADTWYRGNSMALRAVRAGDALLLVDTIDGELQLCVATDKIRDGNAWVVAHEQPGRNSSRLLNAGLRRRLAKLGLSATARAFRTQWVDRTLGATIVTTVFGARMGRTIFGK